MPVNLTNDWSNIVASVDTRAALLIMSALLVAIGTRRRARNVHQEKKRTREPKNWKDSLGPTARMISIIVVSMGLVTVILLLVDGSGLQLFSLLVLAGAMLVCGILFFIMAAAIAYFTREE